LKSYNFDFMDTLALMGTIDHEFNLPGEYICDNFEQKAKKTPNLVSIFTMKFHITI